MKSITLQFLQIIIVVFSITNIAIAQPDMEWVKTYGGSESDIGEAVIQTDDGGYIVIGGTSSNDVDVSGNSSPGFNDWWVVKVDNLGNLQWQKCFGTVDLERAFDAKATPDNGCIVAGFVVDDGSNSDHNGLKDYWILKLDAQGDIEWQGVYGGAPTEYAHTISLTADGGYVVAGSRLIYKLDALGNKEWEKNYGGSKSDVILAIEQTSDLGYVAAGYSKSDDGDVGMNQGEEDAWIIKLDINGDLEWSKAYGGSAEDVAQSVQQSDDGGYIVGGHTESNDGDIENNYGDEDYWILKLDTNGILEWEKNFGGGHNDICLDIKETMDGGFITTGITYSDNDFGGQDHGFGDLWIMKLEPLPVGLNAPLDESKISVFPNPNSGVFTINTSMINSFVNIKLFDVNGKTILEKTNVNQPINVDNLSNGIYFLRVDSKNKTYHKKIIVQNK